MRSILILSLLTIAYFIHQNKGSNAKSLVRRGSECGPVAASKEHKVKTFGAKGDDYVNVPSGWEPIFKVTHSNGGDAFIDTPWKRGDPQMKIHWWLNGCIFCTHSLRWEVHFCKMPALA